MHWGDSGAADALASAAEIFKRQPALFLRGRQSKAPRRVEQLQSGANLLPVLTIRRSAPQLCCIASSEKYFWLRPCRRLLIVILLLILILILLLILILIFATSGGRTQGLRREVTGMDARQALGPRMGPAARSSREQGRSEGTPERSAGAG